MKKIAERKDMPVAEQWDLTTVYRDIDNWEADFAEAGRLLTELRQYPGTLARSGKQLWDFLQLEEKVSRLLDKLYLYAKMKLDEDNRINTYQSLRDRAMSFSVRASEQLSFFTPEILATGSARVAELMEEYPPLRAYNIMFEDILRYAPHTLSKREEEILAMTGEIAQNAHTVFSLFNEADLTFPEIEDADGERIRISHGNYVKLLENRDRRLRRQAFEGLYASYGAYRNTLAATLVGNAKADGFYARVRNYQSSLESALFADNVTETLYQSLLSAVHSNLDAYQEYLALRKETLALDELHFYDIYTPLVGGMDKVIPFEEGFQMVKEALKPLGSDYAKLLDRARHERWLDIRENIGKTSGAYSWGTYDTHPFVLMSYQDNLQSVFTMAHELGHSMHSHYSWSSQPYQYAYYKIFVAEVASTVNEALLTQYLLDHASAREERIYLLNQYLEEFRGTVYRQTMFAEFEKMFHERVENMEGMTADNLSEIYLNLNKQYFGDVMTYDEQIALEWARIPHFYNSFYVYKYAIGFAASAALSQKILAGRPEDVEAYLRFLKSGSADYPVELLKKAGVDLTSPATLDDIFLTFRERLAELRDLLRQSS